MAKLPFRYATGVLGNDIERTVLKLQDPSSCLQLCGNIIRELLNVHHYLTRCMTWFNFYVSIQPHTCFSQPLQQLLTFNSDMATANCRQIASMSLILIQSSPPGAKLVALKPQRQTVSHPKLTEEVIWVCKCFLLLLDTQWLRPHFHQMPQMTWISHKW